MVLNELILAHGLIYSGGFAIIIFISVLVNPRIWMQDFPEELITVIPPKNNTEIKQTFITGFLFSIFIIGFPLYSVATIIKINSISYSFLTLFTHSFSVMFICNILYWLLFDLLIFNVLISRIRTVPGIKKLFKFNGWKRQLFGLFVGVLTCAIISALVVLIARAFI